VFNVSFRRRQAGDAMARSRTSSPDEAAAGVRADLLATKVNVPHTRPDHLGRSRLIQRLDEGMTREMLLVCTPAGFGKTTLLADWAASAKWSVAWLSLDPEDNDPTRFWRYVVAALDRVHEGLVEQLLPLLSPPGVVSSQGMVTALVNQLQASPDELALVLDDYHLLQSRPIHDGMTFLLGHLPPQLHVVIASRSDPPLPLARSRARGQLVELRAADLRFTPEESRALLREAWRLDLAPEAEAAVGNRTEGWAVGLQLAALSLRERPDPDAFLEAFTGTHRYVVDYLSEEVLERQPDQVRTFLLETSILERLSGPLCDAVTGRSDSQDLLEDLERANLFLIPLDEGRRWWRFHHLFSDLLRAELQRADGRSMPELHRRAADWYQQHGLIDETIRHALASGDSTWAARLVEEHLGETLQRAESVLLEQWLSWLPEEMVRSRPRLCLAQAMLEWHRHRLDEVERLLQHVEAALVARPDLRELEVPTEGGMVADPRAAIALLRAQVAGVRGDGEREAEFAQAALAYVAEHEQGPRFWARWLLVAADWHRGRMQQAEAGFAEMLAKGRAAPDPHPLMTTCYPLGAVQRARGELGAALRTFQEGLRWATEDGRFSPLVECQAHLGIAQVLYARDQLEDALGHASEAVTLGRQVVDSFMLALALDALAWIHQAMGDAEAAVAAMDEAYGMLPSMTVASHIYPGESWRARLLLALGRVEEAARWTQGHGLTADDAVSYQRERDYLVLARVLLAGQEAAEALRLLERLDALAASQGRTESHIEIRALRALATHAGGDHQGALTALAEALALARPEGYVRVFADEGLPMAALLRSLVRARQRGRAAAVSPAAREHVNRVVGAFRAPVGHAEQPTGAASGLLEPLTRRELEVLGFVAAGRPNREIAGELVVTLDTVKKHLSHIFDKLGAANRSEAVARARELRLIP
jgi:LuxR family transcriptional regulator, maltose regulon positive regulatory protein